MLQDNEIIRDFKEMKLNEQILISYKEFLQINNKIRNQCGSTLQGELLLWKLYKDTLNFEQESMDMLEKVSQLLNNKKMTSNLASKINMMQADETIDNSVMMMLISGNPKDFHKIILVNKQFLINTGYNLDEIQGKHIDLMFFSGTIENIFLQIFNIQDTKQSEFEMTETIFMKLKSGTIVSMNLSVYINIIEQQGIVIMCILRPNNTITMLEKIFPIQDVFFILTNSNNQLQYFSQNCIDLLKFTTHMYKCDIFMKDLFPMFNNVDGQIDNLDQDSGFLIELNRSALSQYDQSSETKVNRKSITMQMFLNNNDQNVNKDQKLYTFFVTSDIYSSELRNTNGLSAKNENSLSKSKQDSTNMMIQSEDYQDMQSVSSTASISPQISTFKSLSEIKSAINFKKLPYNLIKFRRLIYVIFILILSAALTLLLVNFISKNSFEKDIKSLENYKLMMNYLSISRLSLIMMYGYAQISNQTWDQLKFQFNINQKQQLHDLFQANLTNSINSIHSIISNFSQDQSQRDQEFVYLVTQHDISMQVITEAGKITITNETFFNALQQYIYKADGIAQESLQELKLINGDIFKINTMEDYGNFLEDINYNQENIIQSLAFCLFNGGGEIQDQMMQINKNFYNWIQQKADKNIQILLIITMVCGGIIIVINLLVIPFLLGLQSLQYHITVFNQQVNEVLILDQIKRIQHFYDYLSSHKYLLHMNSRHRFQHTLGYTMEVGYQTMNQDQNMSLEKTERMQSILDEQSVLAEELESQELQKSQSVESQNIANKNVPEDFKENKELKKLVMMKKMWRITAVLIFSTVIGSLYIFSYFISSRILQNLQKGYFSYEVLYNRIPCVSDSLFYMQNMFLDNQTIIQNEKYWVKMNEVINNCYTNENNFKTVKYDLNSIFKDLKTEIDNEDKIDFCNWIASFGVNSEGCNSTAFGGYLGQPSDIKIQIILSLIQNLETKFSSYQPSQVTSPVLQSLFYNSDTLNLAIAQLKYVFNAFTHTQSVAHSSFVQQITKNFNSIIVVFIVFMIAIFFIGIFVLIVSVNILHRTLLTLKLTLKLIPQDEILRLKGLLAKIQVQQL